jgi:23S rRNA pseudouridine2457 synthase
MLIALWKPYAYVSRFTPEGGHPSLAELVPVRDIYPVGRLDHDSEGLLLLGDDGALAHRLTEPGGAHPRTYWVQVEGEPDAAARSALARGVAVQGRLTRPARVRLLREEPALPPRPVPIRVRKRVPTAWLEIELREGRNRQLRRMTAAVGHPTLRLVRVAIGPLRLLELGLSPGEWRALDPDQERMLRDPASRQPRRPRASATNPSSASRPRAKSRGSSSRERTR